MKHIKWSCLFIFYCCADITLGFLRGPKVFVPRPGSRCTGAVQQTSGNGCIDCFCEGGILKCYQAECPKLKLPENPDCKLVYLPGQCCPNYECPTVTSFVGVSSPNDPKCRSTDPCKTCSCFDGLSKCDSYECLEVPVTKPNCKRVSVENQCCPVYYCPIDRNEISSNISQQSCANVKCYMPQVPPSCKLIVQPGNCCPQVDCSTTAPPGEQFKDNTDSQPSVGRCKGQGRVPSNDLCNICFCSAAGQKKCTNVKCPDEEVPKGCKKVSVPGECCPRLQCENEKIPGIEEDSNDIKMCIIDGPIKSNNNCSNCSCKNGWKFCTRTSCENPPLLRGCSLVNVENKCCPEVQCEEQDMSTIDEETSNNDYDDDNTHPTCSGTGIVPSSNPCNICFCKNGRRFCNSQDCPPVPNGCVKVKISGKCCPDIRCQESRSKACTGTGPIPSSDPCNKCSCWKGTRICPSFSCPRMIHPGCRFEHVPDQCCPIEVCDEEAEQPVIASISDVTGCKEDGPIPSKNPCSMCSCKKGSIICARLSCPIVPIGCTTKEKPGDCCGEIVCEPISQDTETSKVRIDPNDSSRCIGKGLIPSPNPCNQCSCSNNHILCVRISCPRPPQRVGSTCTEETIPGKCCKVIKCTVNSKDVE